MIHDLSHSPICSGHLPVAVPVVIDPPHQGSCIVFNADRNEYFKLGVEEARFLRRLDGTLTMEALRTSSSVFSPEDVDALIACFSQNGLLRHQAAHRPAATRPASVLFGRLRIHLWNPDRFLDRHIGIVRAMFGRTAMRLYLALLLLPAAGVVLFPGMVGQASHAYTLDMSLSHILALAALMLPTILLHELGHAVACKRYGGQVSSIGFMLMYLMPAFYCDVSSSWRFVDKRHKLAVVSAGIIVQLLLAAAACSAWLLGGFPLAIEYVIVNLALAILNLLPLVKLDGYWMLAHAIDEPNLRGKALMAIDHCIRSRLHRRAAGARPSGFLLSFGAAVCIATPLFWMIGLLTVHRYVSMLSATLAHCATALLIAGLCFRHLGPGLRYMVSLRTAAPLAHRS